MGQTIHQLSQRPLASPPIFKNRFCVEICEKVHTHYRNLRLVNSLHDWVNMAEGFRDALDRWKKRGCPGTSGQNHIELCRKSIVSESENGSIQVNLNRNLYPANADRIFSEGACFDEPTYIHLKIGDIRIELSHSQFEALSDAIIEAKGRVKNSDILTGV